MRNKFLTLVLCLCVNPVNAEVQDFIEKYEGKSNEIYYLYGKPHIGIGHLIQPKEMKCLKINGLCKDPHKGITDLEIQQLYQQDIKWVEKLIDSHIQVYMTESQKNALTSYVYNVGYHAFYIFKNGKATRKPSKLKTLLNMGHYELAKQEMDIITGSGKVIPQLIERRKEEQLLWENKWKN